MLDMFTDLFDTIHNEYQEWPSQLLFNLYSLIPKVSGGTRPIAKTPLFYRIWCICRSSIIKAWSRDTCPEWEHAAEGKSAFGSAALHQWANEVAIVSNLHSGALLWDIEKFFDTLSYDDVRLSAQSLGYPGLDLELALRMHAAPRLLAVGGATSSALVPARGILQGCMHSFYLSRSVTHKPIARLVKEQREERFVSPTITSRYVDDLVQWSIGLKHNI